MSSTKVRSNIAAAMLTAMVDLRAGRIAVAAATCEAALGIDPESHELHALLGIARLQLDDLPQAVMSLREAVRLSPSSPEHLSNLSAALGKSGGLVEAFECLRRAATLAPYDPGIRNNMGVTLEGMGRFAEAANAYRAAIQLKPDWPEPHQHLGNTLRRLGRPIDADKAYGDAIKLKPDFTDAYTNLAASQLDQGRSSDAVDTLRHAVNQQRDLPGIHSDFLLALNYEGSSSPKTIYKEARIWAARHANISAVRERPNLKNSSSRRLRIGFLSPDLREHPVARMMEPQLRHLDRERFTTICFSDTRRPDDMTSRLRTLSTEWYPTTGCSNEDLERIIEERNLDVLVDLCGHMARNRLPIFASRLAPVQVTHFNYPGTTGIEAMDWRITDVYADPPQSDNQRYYSEKLYRLPRLAWCYTPPCEIIPTSPSPFSKNQFVTFGCLNNPAKISSKTLNHWAEVLLKVPRSRLIVSASGEYLLATLENLGVDRSRIELVPRLQRRGYFELYSRIDILLDPFPYNGGVTSCDGLWMGVPLVTLAGEEYRSRQGSALLNLIGMSELVATTPSEFVSIAVSLAENKPRLEMIRGGLRERLIRSSITDGRHFAAGLADAYEFFAGGK